MVVKHSVYRVFIITFIILSMAYPGLTPAISGSSEQNYDDTIETDWQIMDEVILENQSILLKGNLTVTSTGSLSLLNSSLNFDNSSSAISQIRLEAGAKLNMIKSQVNGFGYDNTIPGCEIFTNEVQIKNCNFTNNYAGLTLHNISNIEIVNCTFIENVIGVVLDNCENVSFINCSFIDNFLNAGEFYSSGNQNEVELNNCTIIRRNSTYTFTELILNKSKLKLVNVTFNNSVQLDITSELIIYWFLHIRITDENDKELSNVEISIIDDTEKLEFNYTTDEHGQVNWITLPQKRLMGEQVQYYNPYQIIAKKKGYSTRTESLSIISTNQTHQTIELKRAEADSETDYREIIYMVCVCLIVVIIVFLSLFAFNIYLMRRKANKLGYSPFDLTQDKGKTTSLSGENVITCSECGAQVTGEATFCPHCGEYFEGEELECPNCKSILSEDDKSCPKCGKVFEKEPEYKDKDKIQKKKLDDSENEIKKPEKLFCSECGGVVNANETRCPGCGLLFEKDDLEVGVKKKKEKQKQSDKQMKVAKKITRAQEEQKKKKKEDLVADELYMCSICGAEIKGDLKKCPKCGTEFE